MAQYTSTQTGGNGNVVNAVLDTETNMITFTVTTPKGTVVTNTQSADVAFNSSTGGSLGALSGPILQGGEKAGLTFPLSDAYNDVKAQAAKATIEATATNTPPPAESQAIPTNSTVDPAVPPAAPAPETETPTSQKNADTEQQIEETTQKVTSNETSTIVEGVTVGGPINEGDIQTTTLPKSIDPAEDADTAGGLLRQVPDEIPDWDRPPSVPPEEDPFEASRLQAEQEYNDTIGKDQQTIDDGSDPYVSNGTTTVTPVPQDDGSDPYVSNGSSTIGITSVAKSVNAAQQQQTISTTKNQNLSEDWRVKLSLAPGSNYLYNMPGLNQRDILYPLKGTNGVIFPYTPTINVNYRANYSPADIVHSNYKLYFYQNSSVEEITIQGDFTAQDTSEANYMLAVIHFFKSVTKMFYGQDPISDGPKSGTPPPLCFLSGFGQYQFQNNPVLITSFQYNLPNDVDYIRAGVATQNPGTNGSNNLFKAKDQGANLSKVLRVLGNNLTKGFMNQDISWQNYANAQATYVPTKLNISIGCIPVVARNNISKEFSLGNYSKGLLQGKGIW